MTPLATPSGTELKLTVTLTAQGDGTRLAWRQSFDSASECEAVRRFAVPANEENLDRLEVETTNPYVEAPSS